MLHSESLPGGPLLLVDPSGSTPVVAVYLWLKAGTAHEPPGLHGAAHLLEHMVFKGAGGHGVGAISALVEGAGGDINAYTTYEQTVLHATVPLGQEDLVIELLADMALRPDLDGGELRLERDVVLEEIRGAQDDPMSVLADTTRGRVWGDHAYGRPILGTEQSVRGIGVRLLRAFHRAAWRPEDIIVAVAGPVDTGRVRTQVEAAFRRRPSPSALALAPRHMPRTPPVLPGVFGLDPGFDEHVTELVFPIPGHADPDLAALDLLAVGLGGCGSSLLNARLRYETDLAMSSWADLESEPEGGLFAVGVSAREGRVVEAVREMAAVLAQLARDGLPPALLRRARASVLGDRLSGRETVDGRAERLAWYQAFFGDPQADLAYEAALQRVTPADVQRVAARWLVPERSVLGAVAPGATRAEPALSRALAEGWAAGRDRRKAPRTGGGAIRRSVLDNGLTVVIEPDLDSELVSASVVGIGGTLVEGADNAGLSAAWAAVVGSGAGDMGALELAASVEERAGSMRPWSGRNSNGLGVTFPAGEVRSCLELLALVLTEPRFDADEVERVRADLEQARRAQVDDPGQYAHQLAWTAMFGGHPWGRPALGTRASLGRLTPRRLAAYHGRVAMGRNLVVAISGAVDPDEAVELLGRVLRRLPAGEPVLPCPPDLSPTFRRRRQASVPRPEAPASIVLAFPAAGHGHADDPASSLLAAALGGVSGGTGRLFDELRERRGLAYSVGADVERGLGGGVLSCGVTTDHDRAGAALRALWRQLELICAEPLGADELNRVRNGLVEGAVLGLQRASSRADHLAAAERYDGGAEKYRDLLRAPGEVDATALREVARRTLRRDRCVVARVGPDRGTTGRCARTAPVTCWES